MADADAVRGAGLPERAPAENGQIVVALLVNQGAPEGVATLKRLYRERHQVRLEPANSEMDPIFVDPENLPVRGRVVAVLRQL